MKISKVVCWPECQNGPSDTWEIGITFMGQTVTIWAAAAGPCIQDPFGFSIVRMLMDRYRRALDTMEVKC